MYVLIELRLNHQAMEERAGCSTFVLFLMSCHCYHLFDDSSRCPWVGLLCVIVAFHCHIHLYFKVPVNNISVM